MHTLYINLTKLLFHLINGCADQNTWLNICLFVCLLQTNSLCRNKIQNNFRNVIQIEDDICRWTIVFRRNVDKTYINNKHLDLMSPFFCFLSSYTSVFLSPFNYTRAQELPWWLHSILLSGILIENVYQICDYSIS